MYGNLQLKIGEGRAAEVYSGPTGKGIFKRPADGQTGRFQRVGFYLRDNRIYNVAEKGNGSAKLFLANLWSEWVDVGSRTDTKVLEILQCAANYRIIVFPLRR